MSKPPNPELVRRILDVALEELGENPPEKVNMRTVAQKSGVSATAIYYYFPSKEALFERIKFDAMAELEGRVTSALRPEDGPRVRLVAFTRAFAYWCLERYNLARLCMGELPPRLDLNDEAMRKYYAVFFLACGLMDEAVAKGELRPRDVFLEVSVAQSAVWGIVTQFRGKRVHPRFWDSIDPLIDRFVGLYFGIGGNE